MDFHAILEVPKGDKHPQFATFRRSTASPNRISIASSPIMARAFRIAGTPFVLPPGTPKDRVEMIQGGFRKTLSRSGLFS